jgi:hypothetical protein
MYFVSRAHFWQVRCTAFHEAGHAIAAERLGIPFESVFLNYRADEKTGFDGMQLGQVVRDVEKSSFAGKIEEAKRQVVQMLAGPHAETLAYPGLDPDLRPDTSDVKDAFSMLQFALCSFIEQEGAANFDPNEVAAKWSQMVRIFNECNREAIALIRENSAFIGKAATELLSRAKSTGLKGVLSRDELGLYLQ